MSLSNVNKIAASLVICLMVLTIGHFLAISLIPDTKPLVPVIKFTPPPRPSIAPAMEHANAGEGHLLALQNCARCHALQAHETIIGPPLLDVFDAPIASQKNFSYSESLKTKRDQKWNAQNLSDWLADPSRFAPGTRMSFAGIDSLQKRADIIAFLRSLRTNTTP